MTTVNPYLNFNGNTEDAFNFYKSVFGGEFTTLQRFKDTPHGFSSRNNNTLELTPFMVEVFKTNVKAQDQADMLVDQIQKKFIEYKVNFDLDDCDKILRVKCNSSIIDVSGLVHLLKNFGFHAEVLPDDPLPFDPVKFTSRLFKKPGIKIFGY